MFELLNDQRRPEIKWWTLPSVLFVVLCLGMDIGILVGRREGDISQWVQTAFMVFAAWWIVAPIFREFRERIPYNDNHDE
jgi:hypothetical protein